MNDACAIGDINYMQKVYKRLNGECKFRTVHSTDTNLIAAKSTNCELLDTLINIFKDSTQIGWPSKSSKYNIALNESSRSTLVNKVVTSEKYKLKDIVGTIYATPPIQNSSKIGSSTVGSKALTNASLSTRASTISEEEIVSSADIDERTHIPEVLDERKSMAEFTKERSGTVAVDERSETATIDESETATIDERIETATIDERIETATIDERIETATIDERIETATIDERIETATIDERIETATIDERSEAQSDEERSGTAAVVYAINGTINLAGRKTEFYKSPKNIYKEINEKNTSVIKLVNENCPDTKSMHSSKLNPYENFDNKINSKLLSDLENFIEAIQLVNSDMVKKSCKLLRNQTLVSEILSYIQATQSVCRLSVPRHIFVDDEKKYQETKKKIIFDFSTNKSFHSAGDCILKELQLYLSHLKADFNEWEFKRTTILNISESIPHQFELCDSEESSRILMHRISTRICNILQEMNDITSRIEDRNIEFRKIEEGIDNYITFSSSFIIDNYHSPIIC